jgi:hypothetical protein
MSAQDVVAAAFRGIELGEVVSAPGVEDYSLLEAVFSADLAAFVARARNSRLATELVPRSRLDLVTRPRWTGQGARPTGAVPDSRSMPDGDPAGSAAIATA